MTRRILALVSACTLVAASASAQTLAELARQEAARRQSVTGGKVITNADLKPVPQPSSPAPSSAGTTLTPPPTLEQALGTSPAESSKAGQDASAASGETSADKGAGKKDEAYWRARMVAARESLARARTFQDALQARIGALQLDFVNRDNPVQRAQVERDLNVARGELERVKKEIVDGEKALTTIGDEARRAGVPAGWVR
jgi:hypothetical protein